MLQVQPPPPPKKKGLKERTPSTKLLYISLIANKKAAIETIIRVMTKMFRIKMALFEGNVSGFPWIRLILFLTSQTNCSEYVAKNTFFYSRE